MSKFDAYAEAGFGEHLLPILPHDAPIHPDSPSLDDLTKKRGKVPGQKRRGGWVGFGDWTEQRSTADDRYIWAGWGAGVGMQGRDFPALDIDVSESELADAISKEAASTFGDAPTRFGRGSRRILVYAGAGFAKRRLAFRRAGGHSGPDAGLAGGAGRARAGGTDDVLDAPADGAHAEAGAAEPPEAVEFLATGQQYVVEGVHPRTGEAYWWRDGRSPAVVGAGGLTPITAEQLDAFFLRLEGLIELYGYEIVSRSALNGSDGTVWQGGLEAPSMDVLARALAAIPNDVDYDTWLKIGAAVKASAGPELEAEALELWMDWSLQWPENTPEQVLAKWGSLHPPFKVGYDFLARYATEEGDGTFHAAAEDFAVAEAPETDLTAPGAAGGPLTAMFDRYVYVAALGRVVDLETGDILGRDVFNVMNRHIGSPVETKACAWAVLTSNVPRLQTAKALTYRPGQGAFVYETLPGLKGRCVNVWTPTDATLPDTATDLEITRWMEHVSLIVPDEREREVMLDWLAWVVQNPGEKPNWSLVIGSSSEGIGKDMMFEPVRVALGPWNVREVGPEDLASSNSDYLERTRLLLIEEMQRSERKAMENKLKPLIAAPPYTLRVNVKFVPQYEIPNLVACVFFTNNDDALAISAKSRRYMVTWNDSEPLPDDYFVGLAAWYAAGGAAKAARWLTQRDVSKFNAKGRAPATVARDEMRKASRTVLEEWVEEGIAEELAPFDTDLIALEDVWARMPDYIVGKNRPTLQRLSSILKKAGGRNLGRVRLGQPLPTTANDRAAIWSVRRHEMVGELEPKKVVALYWQGRAKAEAA